MIHYTGDIYENIKPQLLLLFILSIKLTFSRLMGSCKPFDGRNWYLNQIEVIDIPPTYRKEIPKMFTQKKLPQD